MENTLNILKLKLEVATNKYENLTDKLFQLNSDDYEERLIQLGKSEAFKKAIEIIESGENILPSIEKELTESENEYNGLSNNSDDLDSDELNQIDVENGKIKGFNEVIELIKAV